MIKNKKILIVFFVLLIVGIVPLFKYKKEIYINSVLLTKDYAYLPKEAKEYIKNEYQKNGKILLTEKNKKENKLYLNPQYVEYLTYSDEKKKDVEVIPISLIVDYSIDDIEKEITVPSSYDLRNVNGKNFVTPIRDQGNLGLCWTFSTAGVAESHLLQKSDTSYNSNSKLISERQIDYLTAKNGINDYKSEYVSFIDRQLGSGGNFYISTIALANGVSMVDYNSFKPYDDSDLSKMELSDVISYKKSLYEVNSTTNFPSLNLRESTSELTEEEKEYRNMFFKEIKKNIIENGAAFVSTYMDSSCVYKDKNLNNTVIDVYNCSVAGGHAMEIIGWDDNLEYSYCADTTSHIASTTNCNKIVSGKGVWILKNSWGDVIQNPYLTYDSLYTSISFINEVSSAEDKNWDNNYILDSSEEFILNKTYSLSDSKIRNNEKLEKVKFITALSNTTYKVKITQSDGSYEIFQKENYLPGLITIDITKDIIINKDTEIKVYSSSEFIDKVSIFTSNIDSSAFIDMSKLDNMILSSGNNRFYSNTKNIPSGAIITYKVYDENNNDVSDKVSFTNNIVAENNINTLANFSDVLNSGKYKIDAIYNSNVIVSIHINISKISGLGTKENPYIITNPIQLSQIRNDLDAFYELGNDIDLTNDTREGGNLDNPSEYCPQGFGWKSINGFNGSLDGKGYSIKGLYQNNFITCNDGQYIRDVWSNQGNGLFGYLKGNATIKNIVLEDFDINCQGGDCGVLASKYIANLDDQGNINFSDTNEYNASFENIAVKNTKISGVYNSYNEDSSLNNSHGGGLFGYIGSTYGNVLIKNIYLDINMNNKNLKNNALLVSILQAKKLDIENIKFMVDFNSKYNNTNDSILFDQLIGDSPNNIKNILSIISSKNTSSSILGKSYNDNLIIDGINAFSLNNNPLCFNDQCPQTNNINIYNKESQLLELTKKSNYTSWDGFDDNWKIETIDGITRIPVLKFMKFDYIKIDDIKIEQELNKKYSVFDYMTPKIDAVKASSYKSNNEEIVKINDDGTIVPQSSGNTTIHIESLYDGYIKDIPIKIDYIPHYSINFDANGGLGEMDSIEVGTGSTYTLPINMFTKENYEFSGWNTKADGTGKSYSDLGQVYSNNDKETITLYAQWIGEERVVTFDAAGGIVTPENKIVRYGEKYGELPIPQKSGFAFSGWKSGDIIVDSKDNILSYNLIASWEQNAYNILYDSNGGKLKDNYNSWLLVMSDTKIIDEAVNGNNKKIIQNIYEKEGYVFKGWNEKSDGTGTMYTENQVINLTNVSNDRLILYAVWEEEFDYKINEYSVDETNKYISKIIVNTEHDAFITYFNLNSGYGIDVDYKLIDGKKIIYTGGKTRITKNSNLYEEYTNVVIGDINGDGKINSADLLKVRQHLLASISLSGAYFLSSDINYDNAINSADLLRVRQHLLGTKPIV